MMLRRIHAGGKWKMSDVDLRKGATLIFVRLKRDLNEACICSSESKLCFV